MPLASSTFRNVRVSWHRSLADVTPLNQATVFLAHEFLDALPIHKFQRTDRGWCEVMVDKARPGSR